MGVAPHYLRIPNSTKIVFVTRKHTTSVFHVVDLSSCLSIEIPSDGVAFGQNIGGKKRVPGGAFTDWVESSADDLLVLCTRNDVHTVQIVLDLKSKRVTGEQVVR